MSLEKQYGLLARLKEIDERTSLVNRDIERIPVELQEQDQSLENRRRELQEAQNQVNECEKKLRSAERELKEKEDSLFKAEGKMMEVKTNEEYQAALKENEVQKQAKSALEDSTLQLLAVLEEQKQALSAVAQTFKSYEQGVLQAKKKLNEEHAELAQQRDSLLRQRQDLSAELQPEIAALYQKILDMKKGLAIAFAESGQCASCNLQVRPQIFNEILGHKQIHRCSNCGKILIVSTAATQSEPKTHPIL